MNPLDELRKENDRVQKSLPDGDRKTMQRISRYVAGWKVNAYDAECIRRDLIGMAQEAAARGETLTDAIGTDERMFCTSVVDSARPRSWAERLLFMGNQVLAMLLLFLLAKIFVLEVSSASTLPFGITEVIFYTLYSVAAAYLNHYLVGRLALLPNVARLLPPLLIIGAFVFSKFLLSLEMPVVYVNKYLALGILGAVTLASYLLKEWFVRNRLVPRGNELNTP